MKRKATNGLILKLCLPQFAVGLFTTMLNNYLIYFYQPSKESGLPSLIPQGVVVLGVLTVIGFIKAMGHVIDAVTDPLIAAKSDRSQNKNGRRKMVMACIFALFVSFPFAVLNVLPASMMADIIQYDTITSGINQEGIFGAARSFIVKMGNSFAIMIVPSLTVIGAAAGENVGKAGLKWTAAGALFCMAAVVAFLKYKEGEVLNCIRGQEQNQRR